MSQPLRILVTGSRSWSNEDAVRDGILWALGTYTTIGPPVLVHGACPAGGADWIADKVWREIMTTHGDWMAQPETHWISDHPSFAARNQHMVDLGATCCLAFATSWASGTGQTARMARTAGIPVRDYGVPTAKEDRP